jgi:hypothetical protein
VVGTRVTLVVRDGRSLERLATISLDAPVSRVWVINGSDLVAARAEDRILHLFDVVLEESSESLRRDPRP